MIWTIYCFLSSAVLDLLPLEFLTTLPLLTSQYSLEGLLCVCQLCCCVLVCSGSCSQLVCDSTVCKFEHCERASERVSSSLLFFSSKLWCGRRRRRRHEDMSLGVNPSCCITCVFVPDRSCETLGCRRVNFLIREDYLEDNEDKKMLLESRRHHQGCLEKSNVWSLKAFEAERMKLYRPGISFQPSDAITE